MISDEDILVLVVSIGLNEFNELSFDVLKTKTIHSLDIASGKLPCVHRPIMYVARETSCAFDGAAVRAELPLPFLLNNTN